MFRRNTLVVLLMLVVMLVSCQSAEPETVEVPVTVEVTRVVEKQVEKEIEVTTNGLVELLGGDASKFDDAFEKMMKKKESFSMMLGEDLYYHDKAENIAKLVALVEAACDIDVVMTPPKTKVPGIDHPHWFETKEELQDLLKNIHYNYAFIYNADKSMLNTIKEEYSLF